MLIITAISLASLSFYGTVWLYSKYLQRNALKKLSIQSEDDYNRALDRVEELWDCPIGSPEENELESLVMLISEYEDIMHSIKKN